MKTVTTEITTQVVAQEHVVVEETTTTTEEVVAGVEEKAKGKEKEEGGGEEEEEEEDEEEEEEEDEEESASDTTESVSDGDTGASGGDQHKKGVTYAGESFVVPQTKNPLTLYPPTLWSRMDWVKNSCALLLLLPLFHLPVWVPIVVFLFWRMGYNLLIGLVLHVQSNHQLVTRLFADYVLTLQPDHKVYKLAREFACDGMSDDYCFETTQPCFTAWLLFRHFVDIILGYDLIAYFVLAVCCYEIPDIFSLTTVMCHLAGVVLCVFALWAKTDSFRVVQDYAWYWGDFFFMIHQQLTFDRVFRIAPHPMYTIGYSFYYGLSLICRSYTLLYVSLFAHFAQLLFLAFAETPHMKKIYPELVGDNHIKAINKLLAESHQSSGILRNDLVACKNFTAFRATDIFTAIIVLQHAVSHLLALHYLPTVMFIGETIFWRLMLSGILGYVLHLQDDNGWFTSKCARYGISLKQAFSNWKAFYNMVHTMTWVSFGCCALKVFGATYEPFYVKQVLGVVHTHRNQPYKTK
eukprot:TRINITY_DN930_c0_g1_i1.p1 TRINITY_DN930_c0_g1~~TRINITY_DN930_c0_g1_i1.p1  ORF type:complete len:538 (+),score=163.75 TRINITY_DN930_c0_g1_i1:53-1615(+)